MTQSLWLSGSLDSGKKDFQYWLALRRSDPRRYYASSTQREMIEALDADERRRVKESLMKALQAIDE